MRKLRRGLAFVFAVSAAVAGAGGPTGAVDFLEVGSWWVAQPDAGALPPPPEVQPGGPWVSAAPGTGPIAISAVRFTLAERETSPILTLAMTQDANPLGASILACPTTGQWNPVDAGPWAARPTYDCSLGSVAGSPGLSEALMSFDLSAITTAKVIDVVLLPGTTPSPVPTSPVAGLPTLPNPPTVMDVAFAKPTIESINVFTQPAPPPRRPRQTTRRPSTPTAVQEDFPLDEGTVDLGLPTAPQTRTRQPTGRVRTGTGAATRTPLASPQLAAAIVDEDRANRVLAAIVFVLLIGWWYRLSFPRTAEVTPSGRPRITLRDDPRRFSR